MNYNMKQSGERIQQLRIQAGYTQSELALKLNINRSFLSHIESGKKGCSVDLLQLPIFIGEKTVSNILFTSYNSDAGH